MENVLSRVKEWQVVGKKWRGKIKMRSFLRSVFRLCCALTNIRLQLHITDADDEEEEDEDSSGQELSGKLKKTSKNQ